MNATADNWNNSSFNFKSVARARKNSRGRRERLVLQFDVRKCLDTSYSFDRLADVEFSQSRNVEVALSSITPFQLRNTCIFAIARAPT